MKWLAGALLHRKKVYILYTYVLYIYIYNCYFFHAVQYVYCSATTHRKFCMKQTRCSIHDSVVQLEPQVVVNSRIYPAQLLILLYIFRLSSRKERDSPNVPMAKLGKDIGKWLTEATSMEYLEHVVKIHVTLTIVSTAGVFRSPRATVNGDGSTGWESKQWRSGSDILSTSEYQSHVIKSPSAFCEFANYIFFSPSLSQSLQGLWDVISYNNHFVWSISLVANPSNYRNCRFEWLL